MCLQFIKRLEKFHLNLTGKSVKLHYVNLDSFRRRTFFWAASS